MFGCHMNGVGGEEREAGYVFWEDPNVHVRIGEINLGKEELSKGGVPPEYVA